jgi:hypothetical protein
LDKPLTLLYKLELILKQQHTPLPVLRVTR